LWVSGPLPAPWHDLTAARIWASSRAGCLRLLALGDKLPRPRSTSAPRTGPEQARLAEDANRAPRPAPRPRRARSPAQIWRILRKLAAAPGAPVSWPRPSTSSDPRDSEDENTQPERAIVPGGASGGSECAASGNQRGGHQVTAPRRRGGGGPLVFDAGAGDGQSGEERHPAARTIAPRWSRPCRCHLPAGRPPSSPRAANSWDPATVPTRWRYGTGRAAARPGIERPSGLSEMARRCRYRADRRRR